MRVRIHPVYPFENNSTAAGYEIKVGLIKVHWQHMVARLEWITLNRMSLLAPHSSYSVCLLI